MSAEQVAGEGAARRAGYWRGRMVQEVRSGERQVEVVVGAEAPREPKARGIVGKEHMQLLLRLDGVWGASGRA